MSLEVSNEKILSKLTTPPMGVFRANGNKIMMEQIKCTVKSQLAGGRPVGYFQAEELNSGLPRTTPAVGQNRT